MSHYAAPIRDYLHRLSDVVAHLDVAEIDALAHLVRDAYDRRRTIFVMGNGGSASTASHYACDLNKGACFKTDKKFKVHALTDNLATLLALGNDLDYDSVFVEQLKNFCEPGDVVIGISGSGNSPNVLRAIEYAGATGCTTVGLCGFDGGRLKPMVRHCVHVRCGDMQLVEDIHLVVGHILMQVLGRELGALG